MNQEKEPISVVNYLQENNIDHRILTVGDSSANAADIDMSHAAKSILFRSNETYALAVLPVSERVSSKKLKHTLSSSSLRFASHEELLLVMGCVPGECHPFGTLNNVETFADNTLVNQKTLYFSSGTAGKIIQISFDDYYQSARPHISDLVEQPKQLHMLQ